MRRTVFAAAIALLSVFGVGAQEPLPRLAYNPLSKVFTSTFNGGAAQISLVAQEQIPIQPDSNWPTGWYAFRHNWIVDVDTTVIEDRIDFTPVDGSVSLSTWRVWFEAYYENAAGETVVLYSNVVDVMPGVR